MVSAAKSRTLAVVLLFSVIAGLTGCGDKQFIKQVDEFQKGIDDTTDAVGIYYTELNSFERDLYLKELLFDKSKEVGLSQVVKGKIEPTPLAGRTFSAASIKARMDAIQTLGKYGKQLASLAGTDAPERLAAASKGVGENINGLVTTFKTLSGDPTASSYVGPFEALGAIAGVIGQMILEAKRDAALTKAVKDGAPQVRAIIKLLQQDLETVIKPLRETGTKQIVADLTKQYNDGRDKMSDSDREKLLGKIQLAQERYEIAVAFNPGDLLSSLEDAHNALVKYSESGRKISNLAELVGGLETFRERAAVVATAVKQLRDLRRGGN
jgi:hypothetical protein